MRESAMIMAIAGVVVAFFLGLRLLSGENTKSCGDGQRIEQGALGESMPEEPCS